MRVKPFRGLRPRPDLSSRIPSYPYDVVNTSEARDLADGDPHTFLHVVKPEIDLPEDTDPYDESVYAKGRENLRKMIDEGWLVRDDRPAYYVYRLRMGDHVQTGIVGAAAVQDYLDDTIKKHEFTRPAKEDDRVRLVESLEAHPGPVFLTYDGTEAIDAEIAAVVAGPPTVDFTAPDDIGHTLWVVDDPDRTARLEAAFSQVPATYVADGHHRSAAAARVGKIMTDRLASPTGEEPCNYFLAVHFPADQLRILDYNRIVTDLNGLTPDELVERIRAAGFEVSADHGDKRPPKRGSFGMYLDGRWSLLATTPAMDIPDAMPAGLDVSVLTDRLLQPILGIQDPRTDKRIDFVGGIRGMNELERRVDGGDAAVAFAMYPTSLREVMQVADAGEVMPPKSTWFEPKLRSGMVVQQISGDTL
jgi:uncharacterized protein (DUF1015 family)